MSPAAPPAAAVIAEQLAATPGVDISRELAVRLVQATYDTLALGGWQITEARRRRVSPLLWDYDLTILAGLARGRTVAEIADDSDTPYGTVRHRVERLKARIGARNAAHAVDIAYRSGWMASLPPEPRPAPHLSPRQHQVLGLVAAGLTDSQVADALHLGLGTVATHVHRLYTALGTRPGRANGPARPHAVALAHQHHLLPMPAARAAA